MVYTGLQWYALDLSIRVCAWQYGALTLMIAFKDPANIATYSLLSGRILSKALCDFNVPQNL